MSLNIDIVRIHTKVRIPKYEHEDDSGADIYSLEDFEIEPMGRRAVRTGIAVEIPIGYEIQIRSKSGLALNHGITVLNSPGTIDAGYRGEIKVILINFGKETYHGKVGQKIAQMVLARVERAKFNEVETLSDTYRGDGGFGSTGV